MMCCEAAPYTGGTDVFMTTFTTHAVAMFIHCVKHRKIEAMQDTL